jgi:hypothetical protein
MSSKREMTVIFDTMNSRKKKVVIISKSLTYLVTIVATAFHTGKCCFVKKKRDDAAKLSGFDYILHDNFSEGAEIPAASRMHSLYLEI